MKKTPWLHLEKYRKPHPVLGDQPYGSDFGFFMIPSGLKKGRVLAVIVSAGTDEAPWDHVSVSLPDRCPTWEEMCVIKRLFFYDDECAVQYHPPQKEYVNFASTCLHLWRSIDQEMPCPPKELVGGA